MPLPGVAASVLLLVAARGQAPLEERLALRERLLPVQTRTDGDARLRHSLRLRVLLYTDPSGGWDAPSAGAREALWDTYCRALGDPGAATPRMLDERIVVADRCQRDDVERLRVRLDRWERNNEDAGEPRSEPIAALTAFLRSASLQRLGPVLVASETPLAKRFRDAVARLLGGPTDSDEVRGLAEALWDLRLAAGAEAGYPAPIQNQLRAVLLRPLVALAERAQADGWDSQEIVAATRLRAALKAYDALGLAGVLSGWREVRLQAADWGVGALDQTATVQVARAEHWLERSGGWCAEPLDLDTSALSLPPNVYRLTIRVAPAPDYLLLVRIPVGDGAIEVSCPARVPADGSVLPCVDAPGQPGLLLSRPVQVAEVLDGLESYVTTSEDADTLANAKVFLEIVFRDAGPDATAPTGGEAPALRRVREAAKAAADREALRDCIASAQAAVVDGLFLLRADPERDRIINSVLARCRLRGGERSSLRPLALTDLTALGLGTQSGKLRLGNPWNLADARLWLQGAEPMAIGGPADRAAGDMPIAFRMVLVRK
jgi:hypothetical protein